MRFYVYHYCDPKSGTPFWVGKGQGKRAYVHLTACNRPKHCCYDTFFYKKLRKMFSNGVEPNIEIIQRFSKEEKALKFETSEIKRIGRRNLGLGPLTNLTDGGEGSSGYVTSDKTKQKLREALLGRVISKETRQKIGDFHRGKKYSKETCQKMGEARRGSRHTKESRRKISEALCKPVSCFDPLGNFIEYFDAVKDVVRSGFTPCGVSSCLTGRYKTHKGLTWRYNDA